VGLRTTGAAAIAVRSARPEDVPALTALGEQLGYPSASESVESRLADILVREDHAIYVAEHPEAGVVGWVHVYISYLLERDPQGEIGKLVVSEAHRGSGTGTLLMQNAEDWTRQHGGRAICLRSNVAREAAHAFYGRLGYENVKTSFTFRKTLPPAAT
jgi:GNAT superfamily N-acetyltransferase